MIDRRGLFFLGAALMCFVLVPVANGYSLAAAVVGGTYVVLAAASWLDAWSRGRSD